MLTLAEFVAKFAGKLEPWQESLLVLLEKFDPKELDLRMLDHLEGKPVFIGIDVGTKDGTATVCIAHKQGEVLIIDDIHESIEIPEDRIRMEIGEWSGVRIVESPPPTTDNWPVKAPTEPTLDHDPHPKAKAKLPYFHQRRRY